MTTNGLYIGHLFVRNAPSMAAIMSSISEFLENYPSITVTSTIDDIAHYIVDPNRSTQSDDIPHFYLEYGLTMVIQNEELMSSSRWIHKGKKQLSIELFSDIEYPPLSKRINDDNKLHCYIVTLLKRICTSFNCWFGFFGGPSLFELNPEYLFKIPILYIDICENGPVNPHLQRVFSENGIEISPDATIIDADEHTPYYKYIRAGEKTYQIEIQENNISFSDYSYIYNFEELNEKDSIFIDRILRNEFFTQFYFDEEIGGQIGVDLLTSLSLHPIFFKGNGYFVDWKQIADIDEYKHLYKRFIRKVLPPIIQRIKVEFMEIM